MKKLIILVILAFFIPGCATVYDPVAGRDVRTLYSEEQEIELGRQIAEHIQQEYEVCEVSTGKLSEIGRRVAGKSDRSHLPYTFKVLESDNINAFALPGGFIFMYSGLLDILDESETAAVLGHEIAHVVARHGVKRMQALYGYQLLSIAGLIAMGDRADPRKVQEISDTVFTLILLGYSRRDELEADRLGTRYAIKAGYDPEGMLRVLDKFEEKQRGLPEVTFLNTHPPIPERRREVSFVIAAHEAQALPDEEN